MSNNTHTFSFTIFTAYPRPPNVMPLAPAVFTVMSSAVMYFLSFLILVWYKAAQIIYGLYSFYYMTLNQDL